MNIINVTVRGKMARAEERARVVCGNSDYAVRFDFDEEWAEYFAKTARFVTEGGSYTDVQFEGATCTVPILANTRTLQVGVYAGNLRTTTAALIHALPCVTDPDGTPADPAPDVYSQLMERFNKMEAPEAVLYAEQELTYDQKRQARENIKATGSEQFTIVNEYNEIASCGAISGVCRGGMAGTPAGLTFPAFFLFSQEFYGKRHVTMLDGDGKVWSGRANYSEIQNMTIVRTIPDWSQNDETAADYINNRPFYDDTYIEQVYTGAVTSMGTYTLTSPLVVGDTYQVATSYATFNNVICVQTGNIVQLVLPESNGSINVQDPQNNPLVMMYFGKAGGLNITHKVTEVKKLDAKYLPEKFTVTLAFDSDDNPQVNKTFAEIQEAYDEGRDIRLMMPGGGMTFPMFAFVPNRTIAFNIGETDLAQLVFISSGGVTVSSQSFLPTASDVEPLPSGTASAGSDKAYARADHVHPLELPVASPTLLGGVKPVAKTDDMTAPVGVDADGKLYTAIPAVDMAIDLDEYELVFSETVAEDVASYSRDRDQNGKPFNLTDVVVIVFTKAFEASTNTGNRGIGFLPTSVWGRDSLVNLTPQLPAEKGHVGRYDVVHVKMWNEYQVVDKYCISQNTSNVMGVMLSNNTQYGLQFECDATKLMQIRNPRGNITCVKIVGYTNPLVSAGSMIALYKKKGT